mmetsp:Transcript_60012/g.147578  ORF Transcript_60012/g.147578 Transcript_60012/m.147578 type:complete len:284 (-) Transcript_60012:141-992(-)
MPNVPLPHLATQTHSTPTNTKKPAHARPQVHYVQPTCAFVGRVAPSGLHGLADSEGCDGIKDVVLLGLHPAGAHYAASVGNRHDLLEVVARAPTQQLGGSRGDVCEVLAAKEPLAAPDEEEDAGADDDEDEGDVGEHPREVDALRRLGEEVADLHADEDRPALDLGHWHSERCPPAPGQSMPNIMLKTGWSMFPATSAAWNLGPSHANCVLQLSLQVNSAALPVPPVGKGVVGLGRGCSLGALPHVEPALARHAAAVALLVARVEVVPVLGEPVGWLLGAAGT